MLDLLDFQVDKGGDLKKIRESQRRRHAPESIIDDVVALFEDHKKSWLSHTPYSAQVPANERPFSEVCGDPDRFADKCHTKGDRSKEEGLAHERASHQLRSDLVVLSIQAKEDAGALMQKKADLEKEKKLMEESAAEKDSILRKKVKTIGNYVHDSVPISNNEVGCRVHM